MRLTVLVVPAADAELAADRLWTAGAGAVEETALGEMVELRTCLAQDDERSRERLGPVASSWAVTFVDVDEAPSEAWRNHARPVTVGERLVLRPAWYPAGDDPDVTEIAIEPAGAFGLGDHPTTRLAAAEVDRRCRPGDRVLDAGCGSGVLSIIAARRGAAAVVAVDVAEAAREATLHNARRNGVGDLVAASTTPVADLTGEYDLVVANILAPVLVSLAADLARLTAPGGHLVVSGVLRDRWDHVADALAMEVVDVSELGEWAAVTFRRRDRAAC